MAKTIILDEKSKNSFCQILLNKNLIPEDDYSKIEIDQTSMPFYDDVLICRVFIQGMDTNPFLSFITSPSNINDITVISGNPTALIKTNKIKKFNIDKSNIIEYVKFFFYCVSEQNDIFKLITKETDLDIFSNKGSKINIIKKLFLNSKPAYKKLDNAHILSSMVLNNFELYKANIKVYNDGRVELEKDNMILENIELKLSIEDIGKNFI